MGTRVRGRLASLSLTLSDESRRHELIELTLVSATFVSAEMSALCVEQRDSHGVRKTCVARLLSGLL